MIRSVSYGGGVQSTALLVLTVEGRIDFPLFVFANVGDHAENPDTLAYVRDIAVPYAAQTGVELVERRWVDRTGRERDLYDDLLRMERTIDIPVRLGSGAFGNRKCTARYKIEVVARELRKRGATPADPAILGIGISTDEYQRAKVGISPQQPWTTLTNPLLDLGISRTECKRIITEAGLPVPPKSSCSFCPFQGIEQWREQRRTNPELFARNVALDATLSERHVRLRGDKAGLASATLSLDEAIDHQGTLFVDDGCGSGFCFT